METNHQEPIADPPTVIEAAEFVIDQTDEQWRRLVDLAVEHVDTLEADGRSID